MNQAQEEPIFAELAGTRNKAQEVGKQLLLALQDGTLQSGQRLPSERALAQQMVVSRGSVREALSALERLGILKRRVGDGTYVLPVAQGLSSLLGVLSLRDSSGGLVDLWEARLEIETALAGMCMRSAGEKAISRIDRNLQEMRDALAGGEVMRYLDADKRFHLAIARGADNQFLESMVTPLIAITNDHLLENISSGRLLERCHESLPEHEQIFSAIQGRDELAVDRAVRTHYLNVEGFFGRKYW